MRESIGEIDSPLITLTINTRVPESSDYLDAGDSSSDDTIFTPNSSTVGSPDDIFHTSSTPLLSSAAPMGHNLEAATTYDDTPNHTPTPVSTTPDTPVIWTAWNYHSSESTPKVEQGTATTTPISDSTHHPYTTVVIPVGNYIILDHRRNASSMSTPFATHPAAAVGYLPLNDSPLNEGEREGWDWTTAPGVVPNASETQPGWDNTDIQRGLQASREEAEFEEMRHIRIALEASRAELNLRDFEASSLEQEHIMLNYAEDSSIPRPILETREDQEFYSELLPTELEVEDEMDDLDLEDEDADEEDDEEDMA
ncbi:hypothetical protein HYFRA_00008822 [Hymenoscyphus fraxineus]|uniref:Uncharacterized protein n=1 Tax=Hymenoscyphus fraxineus TaxID=746836 RepID=A0A9N9L0A8_9HELO|nr:hypothetical protein HYFRA_00008822 [Hymenoscyphus fraxineus]